MVYENVVGDPEGITQKQHIFDHIESTSVHTDAMAL